MGCPEFPRLCTVAHDIHCLGVSNCPVCDDLVPSSHPEVFLRTDGAPTHQYDNGVDELDQSWIGRIAEWRELRRVAMAS